MKKIIASLFVICLAIFMSVAFADVIFPEYAPPSLAPTESDLKTAPVIAKLEIHDDESNNIWLEVTVKTPSNVKSAISYYENHEDGYNQAGYIGGIELDYSIDGKESEISSLNYSPNYDQDDDNWNGIFETEYLNELHVDSFVVVKARFTGADKDGNIRYSNWSNELVLNEKADFEASDWAKKELAEADKLGLIPEILKNSDLTKSITREEFAAVSVKAFEALTGIKATPVSTNPFTDTKNEEVLKAYNLGITAGVSETKFDPNALLNREQAATMLARTYKKATMSGWTLATDSNFKLEYTKSNTFADDKDISDWAKDSVYFMNAKGIINGVGDNKFAPKNTTKAEEAISYANATREQAIIIATRMVNKLK